MTREEAEKVIKNTFIETWGDEIIKALEPRKGHWIMTRDYLTTAYGSIDYVKCSCCGEDSLEEGDYCPNCGADMREVEE